MITGVNGHSVDCIKHCGMPVNPHIEARLYTKESNTLVIVARDARNHSHGNRDRCRRRRRLAAIRSGNAAVGNKDSVCLTH